MLEKISAMMVEYWYLVGIGVVLLLVFSIACSAVAHNRSRDNRFQRLYGREDLGI